MNTRHLVLAAGVAGVALAGYSLGKLERESAPPARPAAVAAAAKPAAPAPTAAPAPAPAASAPAATPRTEVPAGHPATPDPGDVEQFAVGNSNVKSLLADGSLMWIGSSKGVIRYDTRSGQHRTFDNNSGLLSNGVFYLGKVKDEIWAGTYGGGLSVLNEQTGAWRNYNVPHGMADAFVYEALTTKEGDVWFATWWGANRVVKGELDNPQAWETYTVQNTGGGLPNDWVYGLAEGKNGDMWVATEGGLAHLVEGKWTNWSHKDGLGAEYETVKAEIPFRNDPGQASSHHAMQKKEQGLAGVDIAYNPNYVISLAVDDDGRVWAGTWGGGLSLFDGRSWRTYTTKDGLPANHVFMLRRDPRGTLWVGTSKGLAAFDGTRFNAYGKNEGLFSENVFSMAFAENGDAWVGSFGGVARFPGGIKKRLATTLQ